MKTAFQYISAAFRFLILKPFDFLLFGGSGVLTIPRAEWQKMIQNDVRSSGYSKAQICVDGGAEEGAPFPKWLTTNLPTVYDGPQGDSFFMDIEK